MWAAYLRIFQILQKIRPIKMIYSTELDRLVENPNICKKGLYLTTQVVQAFIISTYRMLNFLRTEKGAPGRITFVDFVVDLLVWAITALYITCCWSYHKRWDSLAWYLNQKLLQREKTTATKGGESFFL